MKRLIIFALIFAVLSGAWASAENLDGEEKSVEETIEDMLGAYDFSTWNEYLDLDILGGEGDIAELIAGYTGGQTQSDPSSIISSVKRSALDRVKAALISMVSVFALALSSGLALSLFPNGGKIYDALSLTVSALMVGIIAYCFSKTAALATNTIDRLGSFCELSLPVLSTMLTVGGNIAGAGITSPLSAFLSTGVIMVIKSAVMPMILITGVLSMVNNLADRMSLNGLCGFFKSSSKWILGLLSTLYFSICSIKGLVASSYDSVTVKTTKYALDKLVPVAGSFVSGTVDTVLLSANALKNAAGIASIVVTASIVTAPLIEILSYILAFRLLSGLVEPISDKRIGKMLSSAADVLGYVFSATLIVGAMVFITFGFFVSLFKV